MEKVTIRIVSSNNETNPSKKKHNFKLPFFSGLLGFVVAGLFTAVIYVFALPYAPGETTNPTCLPSDTDCTVVSSVPYTGASANVDLGSRTLTTTGAGSLGSLTLTTTSLSVGNGGTGNSSLTAYALLAGGTTASGALQQVSGLGNSGQILTSNGATNLPSWQAAGANAALSNLASVAVNAVLIPGTAGALDFGSATKPWADIYLAGTSGTPGTNNFKITGVSTSGTRIVTIPDASGTVTLLGNASVGSGSVVLATSPTLSTPNIGVATATSVNGLTITSSTGTLTVTDGKILSISNTLTFTGTDSSSVAFGTGGTVTYTANKLSVFSATSSSELGGVISDETGSGGALVFASSPVLTSPNIGAATGTSATLTNTGGAQAALKYDTSNYATLTTASNGDFTLATTSGSSAGQINLTSAITGDATILGSTGTLVLGGSGGSNNETLKLDFETYANKVAFTSGTSVTDLDFGSLNFATTGTLTLGGSTTGTLVTRVKAGAANESDSNGSLVVDSTNGRLYFRYGGAWHYAAQTAGFQIPDFETIDPISGEEIKEGDVVLGMINKTFEDHALHGVWVKWDSLKSQLLSDIKEKGIDQLIAESVKPELGPLDSMMEKVKGVLFSLGISIKDGVAHINQLAVQRSDTEIARIRKIEMVDAENGKIYCTWIKNGEWIKAEGECDSVEVASAVSQVKQDAAAIKEQVTQDVKDDLAPVIESQVQAEVLQQLQDQQESKETSVENKKEEEDTTVSDEPATQIQPEQNEQPAEPEVPAAVPTPDNNSVIEQTTAALMNGMGRFLAWLFEKITPSYMKSWAGNIMPLQKMVAFVVHR